MHEVMRNTLAELELMGPPSPVRIRLLEDDKDLLAAELPLDCVDSETLPCLVVWLLEWAQIQTSLWNSEDVSGEFMAEDRRRGIIYGFVFHVTLTHLSEGLYRRTLSIVPSVSMCA